MRYGARACPRTGRQDAVVQDEVDAWAGSQGSELLQELDRREEDGAPIGGLKVATANGWFAARPSGTEDVYNIYAESFLGREHLARVQDEARALAAAVLAR